MESLERKLDRLSPAQRKETEDFVDFLLSRSVEADAPPGSSCDFPRVLNGAPPPLMPETVNAEEIRPVSLQDPSRIAERAPPAAGNGSDTASIQEIDDRNDWMTHDYVDYGQFEHPPSPATEAVKKVKRKIIAREEKEKPHLLDWVD